jgi:hypothetical protein
VRLMIVGTGVLAASGMSVLLCAGAAWAGGPDDYAGMTYSDAQGQAARSGLTPVVMSRVGGELTTIGGKAIDDDCIVERSQISNFFDSSWTNPGGRILFYLNCENHVATAGKAGNSAASPEGRAELVKQAQEAARERAQQEAARQESEQAELEGGG